MNLKYISVGVYNDDDPKNIQHEHVITVKKLIQEMIDDPANARQHLKKAEACLVTKKEHLLLNRIKDFSGWERYRQAGIDVYEFNEGEWHLFSFK